VPGLIDPLPAGGYVVLIPQAAQPGQPLVLVPIQVSTAAPITGPRPGIATYLLERAMAGLTDIKVALQIIRSLPLIVIPQQDSMVDTAVPITVNPAAAAGSAQAGPTQGPGQPTPTGGASQPITGLSAPIQLIPAAPATFNVPFVVIAPLDLQAPLHLVIPPQEARLGIPLLVVPDTGMRPPPIGDAGLKALEAAVALKAQQPDGTSNAFLAWIGVALIALGLGGLSRIGRRGRR
jgi:hypothetical protein